MCCKKILFRHGMQLMRPFRPAHDRFVVLILAICAFVRKHVGVVEAAIAACADFT